MRLLATSIFVLAVVIATSLAQQQSSSYSFSPSPRILPHPEDMVYRARLFDTNTGAPEVLYEVPSDKWLVILQHGPPPANFEGPPYARWVDASGAILDDQPASSSGQGWSWIGSGVVGIAVPPGSRFEVFDDAANPGSNLGTIMFNGYLVDA